jgi:putative ABC transport system permease protein
MILLLLRATLRLLSRNKILSVIKVLGLSIGAAVFIFTSRFSLEEINYDKQHPDWELFYRYVHRVNTPEGMQSFAFTSALTGPALKERFAEVSDFTRVFVAPSISIRNERTDISFNERHVAFVDDSFFTSFHFPLRSGAANFSDPLSLIITPSMAKKYFGDDDPIGRTLEIGGALQFVVRGVFYTDFSNTHFNFEVIAPFSALEAIRNAPAVASQVPASLNLDKKGFNAFYTYLKLAPGSSAALEAKFPEFIEEFRGKGRSERLKPSLQPMQSIHLESDLLYEIDRNGSRLTVYVYFFVGLLVLIIACINYVNISTAEIINRARGIGLKKILGITRRTLFGNYLFESAVLIMISVTIGLLLVVGLSTPFNMMVNRSIAFLDTFGAFLFGVVFVSVTVLSGLYPAWLISLSPGLESFKGSYRASQSSLIFRNALVFFQLVVSFCLVTISAVIYYQLDFLMTRDPGFDAAHVMTINATSATRQQRASLKTDLAGKKGIDVIGMCSVPPGGNMFSYGLTLPQNNSDEDRRVLFYQSYVDADFLEAIGITLDSGRFFEPASAADSMLHIVINRTGVKAIGTDILSRPLEIPDLMASGINKKSVVGVVNDFNFASFHRLVEPLSLEYNPDRCNYLLVRFSTSEVGDAVRSVQASWKELVPTAPLDYAFLNDQFTAFYEDESHERDVVATLAVLAIGLASLGIFGTTLFLVQVRTREMGIRKMLGSGQVSMLMLLARPLFLLVTIACAAGVPLSLFYGNKWLEPYPFRIEYSPWILIAGFGVTLLIVGTTALYHFLNVTRVNPVEVIRGNG